MNTIHEIAVWCDERELEFSLLSLPYGTASFYAKISTKHGAQDAVEVKRTASDPTHAAQLAYAAFEPFVEATKSQLPAIEHKAALVDDHIPFSGECYV